MDSQHSSTFCFSPDTFATAANAASARAQLGSAVLAHAARPFNLKRTFNKLGPPSKLTLLKKRNFPHRKLSQLITERAQLTLPKKINGSLPSAASSIRCYNSFCELISVRPFPPTEEAVAQRSCVSNDTDTYRNYVGQLRSACFFYRLDTDWLSMRYAT